MLFHDLPGGGQHVPGARVIAKAFPETQHFFFRGGGQAGHIRKAGHPALEIAHAALHLGLLQHDFGDPHLIGRIVDAPGQRPLVRGRTRPREPSAIGAHGFRAADEGTAARQDSGREPQGRAAGQGRAFRASRMLRIFWAWTAVYTLGRALSSDRACPIFKTLRGRGGYARRAGASHTTARSDHG